MAVQPIPKEYPGVSAYLAVHDAAAALEFYAAAFGARERARYPGPDGRIGHAELELAGSVLMLADEYPEIGFRSPRSLSGSPVTLMFYVTDVDAAVARAVTAGATVQRPLANQFYGDRSATLADPFGHVWTIATHVEDVSPEEMRRRMESAPGH